MLLSSCRKVFLETLLFVVATPPGTAAGACPFIKELSEVHLGLWVELRIFIHSILEVLTSSIIGIFELKRIVAIRVILILQDRHREEVTDNDTQLLCE